MSILTTELIEKIEQIAPPAIKESWDNSGWQIHLARERRDTVLIALEITKSVIQEARENEADLILVHHPLIMYPVNNIDDGDFPGCYIDELICGRISVYAAHTSFDSAEGGMNDTLAQILSLEDVRVIPTVGDAAYQNMARSGRLRAPMTFLQVCRLVKDTLSLSNPLRIVGDPDQIVHTVALCGGAGGDLISSAIQEGIDLFLTGDVKHHQAQWAKESGLCLIDGAHWGTEKHFVQVMAERIGETFGDKVNIIPSACDQEPFHAYF